MEKFEQDCDAALSWIARFRSGQVEEGDRQAFALWLSEDPAHGRAMDSMQELWDDLGSLQHMPEFPQAESPSRRRWIGASMAVAASALVAMVLLPRFEASQPEAQYFQTALGEQRTITLDDGSRLTLNTDTRLSASMGEELRHIELLRGEAFFEVTSNKERPFEVDAGSTRVTVVGTAFNVFRRSETTSEITVSEGVVRVSEQDTPASRAPATEILHAEQRLVASQDGFKASAAGDIRPQLAWRDGELVAREMPLSQLAAELERYQKTRILIADPSVAALTVSGVFQLNQPLAVLDALERSMEIRVARIGADTLQLLPAAQ
ncbi:FecR family protein [Parahaliea maris]|uniref:FecR family protein n=1 Tax=Parahaliea maris TaxID=2716870 RepID=A0A5C8ZTU7_9GAMM|nr:FecR family protein [Parahaliea maris]TXS90691.1 FecR family protein [Parahaliea maris]